MDAGLQPNIQIIPLTEFHNHRRFSSGSAEFQPLKTFLQNDALSFQNGCIAQTYVAVDDNERMDKASNVNIHPYKVLGYITLTCSQVALTDYPLDGCERAGRYEYLPAVKIARLAIDATQRRSGLGSRLFQHALLLACDDIRPRIGCRFLITDAKRTAIDFYQNQGMVLLDTEENQAAEHPIMFIDLYTLKDE
ncbi:TPA: GNAT family N-acetyltransferase [Serratia marcescens]|uniref:GNAT family N-acetyltransferase n=1 Tax=Serratia TaxID=613 RepID=UPI00135C5B8A|nr:MULTISPECIES: GNAT family N-acetyltransferase [Serratia]QPJ88638.1 GNAT family N-acetyltransferase [Serratia marcescens]HAT3735757.1 GNAT family N-acetyltransferase [Serratia marcescens]